jgi:hypothetical protein
MNSSNQRVGLTNNHCGRQDLLATKSVELPDPRKGEGFEIFSTESLLPIGTLLPLIKTSGWNKAAALCECLTE